MKKLLRVFGALAITFGLVACSSGTPAASATPATEATPEATEETSTGEGAVQFAVVYGAAHGTKCFTSVAVVVNAEDGTIIDTIIDEYQYFDATTEGLVPVPNSDGAFNEGAAEGMVLGSKRVNADIYSALMADHAGSTVALNVNYDAIEDYAKGKKADELKDVTLDAVTGATLVDTPNYLALIAEAATTATSSSKKYTVADASAVTLGEAEYAAHGDKCFTLAVDVLSGDTIVAAYVDEFQYMSADAGVTPVPNGTDTEGFAGSFAEGNVLVSKKVNNDVYSANMKEKAQSTVAIADNYAAIEDFCAGKTIDELSGYNAETDAVTGATLVDTPNYILAIINAAQNSK